MTCSKSIINEPRRSPTRSKNVYLAIKEHALIAVFNAVFCFTHAEHNLIKLRLHDNLSAQAINSLSERAM